MVLLIVCLYSPIKWRLYRPLCYILCIINNYSITLDCQPSQHKTICLDQNANYGLLMFICPQFYVSIPDEDEEDFAYLPWPCCLLLCQRRISAPDSVSSPAPTQPSPAPAELYPVIISISCADETDRDVSPAVITDRVQNNANFLIPFARFIAHLLKHFKYYLHINTKSFIVWKIFSFLSLDISAGKKH